MAGEARTRIGVDLPPDLHEQMRAAFYASSRVQAASLSEFVVTAILAHVARLEADHNGGQPWPAASAGSLPRRRGPGGRKERMMARLTESQASRIRGAAKALDRSVADLCEAAVREYIEDLPLAPEAPQKGARGRPARPA